MKNIFFVGLKNSGKTTIGKGVAEKLSLPFYDSDDLFLSNTSTSPREYSRSYGKEEFRKKEYEINSSFLKNKESNYVFSFGGGISENKEILEQAKESGIIIYLYREEKVLFENLCSDGTPSFIDNKNKKESFSTIFKERDEIYKSLSTIEIDFNKYFTPEDEVEAILEILKENNYVE